MLALPEGSFKIGKRKVRLQKYLSSGQSSALKRTREPMTKNQSDKRGKLTPNNQSTSSSGAKPRIDLSKEIETSYKGPDQSKELANLDKDERKRIKSANQLRVERRLLKKQNKLKIKILSSQKSKKQELQATLKPFKSALNKLAHKDKNKSTKPSQKARSSKPKPGPNKVKT